MKFSIMGLDTQQWECCTIIGKHQRMVIKTPPNKWLTTKLKLEYTRPKRDVAMCLVPIQEIVPPPF